MGQKTLDFSGARNISAQPDHNNPVKTVAEFVTGIPLDRDWWHFASPIEKFMTLAPVAGGLLLGASGLSRVAAREVSELGMGIKKDPFGLANGNMDRRVFLDRIMGNTTKRAQQEFTVQDKVQQELWDKYSSASKAYHERGIPVPSGTPTFEQAQNKWTDYANFGEQFNQKYGWPNAVVNPEKLNKVRWIAPGEKDVPTHYLEDSGAVAQFYNAVKSALLGK